MAKGRENWEGEETEQKGLMDTDNSMVIMEGRGI